LQAKAKTLSCGSLARTARTWATIWSSVKWRMVTAPNLQAAPQLPQPAQAASTTAAGWPFFHTIAP
jgi:hypothetical protein